MVGKQWWTSNSLKSTRDSVKVLPTGSRSLSEDNCEEGKIFSTPGAACVLPSTQQRVDDREVVTKGSSGFRALRTLNGQNDERIANSGLYWRKWPKFAHVSTSLFKMGFCVGFFPIQERMTYVWLLVCSINKVHNRLNRVVFLTFVKEEGRRKKADISPCQQMGQLCLLEKPWFLWSQKFCPGPWHTVGRWHHVF